MQTLTKKKRILDNITQQNLQLPYMKLLTKVHKLDHSVSRTNPSQTYWTTYHHCTWLDYLQPFTITWY